MIALCEIWVNKLEEPIGLLNEFTCIGFIPAQKDCSKGRWSGGLLVLVKSAIAEDFNRIPNAMSKSNVLWLSRGSSYFGFAYWPPVGSRYSCEQLLEHIEDDLFSFSTKSASQILLMGDLNARVGELDDRVDVCEAIQRRSEDKECNARGQRLIDLCHVSDLKILNGRFEKGRTAHFTFLGAQGKSVIDLGLVREEDFSKVAKFTVHDRVESSHMPISVTFHHGLEEESSPELLETKTTKMERYALREDQENEAVAIVEEHDLDLKGLVSFWRYDNISSDEAVSLLSNWMSAVFLPMKKAEVRNNSKKKRPAEVRVKNLKRQVVATLRRFRRTRTTENLSQYLQERKEFKEKASVIRQEDRQEQDRIIDEIINGCDWPKKWKLVKRLYKRTANIQSGIDPSKWLAHFSNVLCKEFKNTDYKWKVEFQGKEDEMLDRSVTVQEIETVLKSMKNGKAPGMDGFPVDYFKKIPRLQWVLCELYNIILQTEVFPEAWSASLIHPIYKGKGNPKNTNSYRGISLLPCIGKVFTKLLNSRLVQWMKNADIKNDFQAAYKRGFSTTDQCFVLDTIVKMRMQRKQETYCCYVDFTKAFDSVNRNALYFKLHKIGVSDKFVKLVMSMYERSRFAVRVGLGARSELVESNTGVLQGCQLSPVLFTIFLDDLPEALSRKPGLHAPGINGTEVPLLMYADDICLMSATQIGLQRSVEALQSYCLEWGLEVNVEKTKVQVFTSRRNIPRFSWKYMDETLEVVKTFKYLGVVFATNGRWMNHVNETKKKAKNAVFRMGQLIYKTRNGEIPTLLKLFDALVAPIMSFGCELMSFGNIPQLDAVARFYYKRILGLPTSAPGVGTELILGRASVSEDIKIKTLSFWLRVQFLSKSNIVKECLKFQQRQVESGRSVSNSCWLKNVQQELRRLDLENVYGLRFLNNTQRRAVLAQMKIKIREIGIREQHSAAKEMRSINEVESVINSPPELNAILATMNTRNLRRKLAGFLLNVRGNKISFNGDERICKLCQRDLNISVFIHRLRDCPRLENIRVEISNEEWFRELSLDDTQGSLARTISDLNHAQRVSMLKFF